MWPNPQFPVSSAEKFEVFDVVLLCKLTLFQRPCNFLMPYLNIERTIQIRFTFILFCFVRVYFVFDSMIEIESIFWRIPGSFIDTRYLSWITLNTFLQRRRAGSIANI